MGWKHLAIGAFLTLLLLTDASAQSIYGTLTGIVSDPSQAVISGADVKLRDEQSGSQRDTITNSDGFYTFISVPPGAYRLTVMVAGFETYVRSGIAILGGDKINVNVSMTLGRTTDVVEVKGQAEATVLVDSGEKSDRLTIKELDSFIQIGSNAAEFIKILPGFGISNGTSNIASYTGETIGINGNGNGGNQSPLNGAYSYNGLPNNSLDITADGAHVSDPGCNCATPVNPNSKMISELKVTISNFNAESQKGPGVVSSVARGGGQQYHGAAFVTVRDAVLNANDWLSNYSKVPRPDTRNQNPGGSLGGPVRLPFTDWNKKRDKMFFFSSLQYFHQIQDTGLLRATVPTEGERNGIFTPEELAKLGKITASGAAATQINARGLAQFPGAIIPASQLDPNMKALVKNYPLPNADPNANGGYNWVDDIKFAQNNVQWMSRIDYSISDNTKLYVRYNLQRESQLFPIGLWSTNKLQQVPLPSPIVGKNRSDSVTASVTHVFNSSMTNEVIFGYTFIGFPNTFQDPDKMDRTKIGYTNQGLYKNGVTIIPNIASSGEAAAITPGYGGFEVGGARGLYADKYLPSLSDTVSKVWGTHTLKAGFFWEWIRNSQPASNSTQGQFSFSNGSTYTIGNVYADMMIGNLNSYAETSFNRINDEAYSTWEGFLQDSWKVTRRLSLELGLRITHFEPWQDRLGFGFSVFDYSKYNSSCKPVDYCGFLWHSRDKSVPIGGFPTRTAYYAPRFGMAYSLTPNTVIRGGFGRYYFHSAQFTTGLNVSAGMQSVTLGTSQGLPGSTGLRVADIDKIPFASAAISTGAVDRKSDRSPFTDSYSFTLSRRIPWSGLVEIGYVGNQTRNALNTSGGAGSEINAVPVGAMLASNNGGKDPNSLTANNYRPMPEFAGLAINTHNLYYNYNALQATYRRSRGNAVFSANYTFGKAMGILNPTFDSFNLNNDYGVQSTNRPHIFNLAYSYTLGKYSRNKFVGGAINSWQVSGMVQLQSGVNLTGQRNQFNTSLALNSYKIPGTTYNVSNTSLYGTPNLLLTPIVTCDPKSNLGPNQYINPNCFAVPNQIGQYQGVMLPVIYGPRYFNTDLAINKNFTIKEKKKLTFKAQGFNFLNHPLWSFNGSNLNLGYAGATGLLNTPLFGTVTNKQGRRVIQLAVDFNF